MFFADDCFIFSKASTEYANTIQTMLGVFEKASGQLVNIDKSTVFSSKNTCNYLKNDLCSQLGFKEAGDNSTYLGLPSFISRKKSVTFGYVKDRLKERLQGWGKKNLSRAGNEILLKSSAQTLPNYTMNVFLIPVNICNELEKDMCKYWWRSNSSNQKSIHWMSWERMSERKGVGGMGFRNIRDLNIALLGK
ncbi:uncharacterized protein LOC141714536 [Apium graveolens]|uniref:uncharacterized protein LOC141714536 n=1 Tax=Apium graveolens TaxID=4045 RepID=UPI003D78D8A3